LGSALPVLIKRANTANIEEELLAVVRLYPHTFSPLVPVPSQFPVGIAVGFNILEKAGYLGSNQSVIYHSFSGRYYYIDNIFIKGELAALDAIITGGAGVEYFSQRLGPFYFFFLPGPYEPEQATRGVALQAEPVVNGAVKL
jgi:hypothetical protein